MSLLKSISGKSFIVWILTIASFVLYLAIVSPAFPPSLIFISTVLSDALKSSVGLEKAIALAKAWTSEE